MQTTNSSTTQIQHICLRLLAIRDHSERELYHKLALRGFSRESVEPVLRTFIEKGWLDNDRFAESYARQRIQKGFGPLKIGYELQQKGVEAFDDSVCTEAGVVDWQQLIRDVYLKKFGSSSQLTRQQWMKQHRFLQSRGFSFELIKQLQVELNIKITY